MKSVSLKAGGTTWGHFGRVPLFHEASNMRTHFFSPNPSGQVMHNCHLVHEVEIPEPNWTSYVKANGFWFWVLHFGQCLELPSKTNDANLTKNSICLEFEVFICYFDPHDRGHHPTPVDAFHPRGLPPCRSQTHWNIKWQPILGCMSICGLKYEPDSKFGWTFYDSTTPTHVFSSSTIRIPRHLEHVSCHNQYVICEAVICVVT